MVANFASGGAAINQLARATSATLASSRSTSTTPTADFTRRAGDGEAAFLAAVAAGYDAVSRRQRPDLPGRDGDRQHHRRRGALRRRCSAAAARAGPGAAPASTTKAWPASGPRSTRRSRGIAGVRAIRCGRGGARRPRARRHPRRGARRRRHPFRCCSTALSAPPRRRRSRGCVRTDSSMPVLGACFGRSRASGAWPSARAVPLLDFGMRLGEASGAALAVPLAPRGACVPRRHGDVRGAGVRTGTDRPRDRPSRALLAPRPGCRSVG